MKLHPRVTRSVVELVKRFEGLRRHAGRLPDGGWTIGYGHTRSAREGAVVSAQDAEALLYYDLSEVAQKVEAWTFSPLNQNQFEALVAFAFNIGMDNFRHCAVLKRVNEGQHLKAAAALELWRKAEFGGEDLVIDALVRRRAAEKAHYLTPPEGFRPSPTPILKPSFDQSLLEGALVARLGGAAVMVHAPLDGKDAAAALAPVRGFEEAKAAAPSILAMAAAGGAVGAASAQLHRLFPDKGDRPSTETATPSAAEEFQTFTAMEGGAPLDGAPFGALPPLDLNDTPPPPFGASSTVTGQKGGANAALLRDVDEGVVADPFNTSAAGPVLVNVSLSEEKTVEDLKAPPIADAAKAASPASPGPRYDRFMIFLSIGLLGGALFCAALFSIFTGKATPANLVIGLIGILLMTPAAGFYLMRFFEARDRSRAA